MKNLKSIRFKLFSVLCIVILFAISFMIIVNNIVLENVYLNSKREALVNIYKYLNNYYNNRDDVNIELELERMALNNDFDIMIRDNKNNIYVSSIDFFETLDELPDKNTDNNEGIMYFDNNMKIRNLQDKSTGVNFILLTSTLDCGYKLYIRASMNPIKESVQISNDLLFKMAGISILIGGIIIAFITRKITEPIIELNDMANKMARLDFSKKYRISDSESEINELGKSMNYVSDKLENTIKQLKKNNLELERDIEKKSKIDEMRKQFISDVSHELKTPIALIQGYAEGLIENVNEDEESKNFYSEVILDEANKMDKLVKQLLELMKLEYDNRAFNDSEFDIVELINEVIRKTSVMLDEKFIQIEFKQNKPVLVYADDFYIEQIVTNYITNAIKNVEEIDGKKQIIIDIDKANSGDMRIKVFNTGKNLSEEDMQRIWNRFYKVDESRERVKGGSGIGLSIVKAIMNKYDKDYGVINMQNGVEFYFDCAIKK